MNASDVCNGTGVAVLLRLKSGMAASFDEVAAIGRRELKAAIGTTNYAALLADTLDTDGTTDKSDACVSAAKRFAACAWYRDQQATTGSNGILMSVQIGDGTETFASAETVARMANQFRASAVQELRRAGLYQEITPASGTLILPEDEEDD